MSWNYRILRHKGHFALHEVYYDEHGKPEFCTEESDIVVEEDEGVEGILNILRMMLGDVERSKDDILDYDSFP